MKLNILISFVTIALSSTVALANVIPFAGLHAHTSRHLTLGAVFLTIVLDSDTNGIGILAVSSRSTANAAMSSPIDTMLVRTKIHGMDARFVQLRRSDEHQNNDYGSGNSENNRRDHQYLNLVLLLKELLVAFFERGLPRYAQEAFMGAGYPEWVHGRYQQIAEHERIHRDFIRSAITAAGGEYIQPCRYNFYDNDVHGFVEVSEAIKTIATSSHIGSMQYLSNMAYITTGASILAVDAQHGSWINSAVRKQNPSNTAFETPLTPNQVATLLSNFFDFESCPSGNRNLLPPGYRPYPRLSLSPKLVPGEKAEISFPPINLGSGQQLYVAFLTGIETVFVAVEVRSEGARSGGLSDNRNSSNDNGENNIIRYFMEIPPDLSARGTVFVILVHGPEDIRDVNLDENNIVAGPAIASFPFDSNNKPVS